MEDVGECWQPRQLDRIAFVPPKSAGVRRANEKEKDNERGKKDCNDPLGGFDQTRVQDAAGILPCKKRLRECE